VLKLSITVVAILSATASFASADISYVFVDTTDTIQLNVNGSLVDTACGSNNNEGGSTGFCGTVLGGLPVLVPN
jgi:hypothetical protein